MNEYIPNVSEYIAQVADNNAETSNVVRNELLRLPIIHTFDGDNLTSILMAYIGVHPETGHFTEIKRLRTGSGSQENKQGNEHANLLHHESSSSHHQKILFG